MPRNLFKEMGISSRQEELEGQNQPKNLFKEFGIESNAQQIQPQQQMQRQPTWYEKLGFGDTSNADPIHELARHPLTQGVLGAGDALAKMYSLGILRPKSGEGAAYEAGKIGGDIGGYYAGGELLGALAPAQSLLSKAMQAKGLGGALRGIAGGAAAGAAVSPEDRLKGAGIGATLSAGGELIAPAFKGAKSLWKGRPQKQAESLIESLRDGKNLEQNALDIANQTEETYRAAQKKWGNEYDNIFRPVNKDIIELNEYSKLDPDVIKGYGASIKKYNKEFMENPTVEKAHSLLKRIGGEKRRLEAQQAAKTLTEEGNDKLHYYNEAYSALKKQMKSHFDKTDPSGNLAKKFADTAKGWAENVAPYESNSLLARISTGDIKNPKKIMESLKSILSSESAPKLVEDMGESLQNKLMYNEFGRIKDITPENILKVAQGLESKGLGQFKSKALEEQIGNLEKNLRKFNRMKTGAKIGAGIAGAAALPSGLKHLIGG
jgi:hypothetical protein